MKPARLSFNTRSKTSRNPLRMVSSTSFSTKVQPSLVKSAPTNGDPIVSSIVRPSFSICLLLPIFKPHSGLLVLEHGTAQHRELALDHLLSGLLEYATNEQGSKSVSKALKEGGKDALNKIVKRMCEPAKRFVLPSFLLNHYFWVLTFTPALGGQWSWTSRCLQPVVSSSQVFCRA